jgi:lysophospholipase L1-like esterase
MKRILTVLSVVVIAGIFFVGAGEIALRAVGYSAPIWFQPDDRLGWGLRPNVEGWYTDEGRGYVKVNAAGFRDRAHALDKPAGTYRVAVVGDSAVEALQLEMEKTFWSQLEKKLRACPALGGREVEVLAFGVSGYGTAQQHLLIASTALRYQPDLVLLAFAGNDVVNNSARLESDNERPFFLPDGERLRLDLSFANRGEFLKRSSPLFETYRASSDWLRVVQLVQAARRGVQVWREAGASPTGNTLGRKRVPGVEPSANIAMFAPPQDPALEEAWTITERILALTNRLVERHNARFAVTPITHSAQVDHDQTVRAALHAALGVQDVFYTDRRLEALGQREGFTVIPLAAELQRRADAGKIHFHGFPNYRMGWGHWNEVGHHAAADIIAPRLCAQVQPEQPQLRRATATQ